MKRPTEAFCRFLASMQIVALLSTVSVAEPVAAVRIDSVVLRPLDEAEVPAQQTGLLLEIAASEGQRVEQGQLLASLDAQVARLAVEQAKLEHAQAEAKADNKTQIEFADKALEVARAELRRSSESLEKFAKSISQSQLDVEQLTVEKLILERRQAEHELKLKQFGLQLKKNELAATQLRLEQHQLRAPFAGTVVLVRGRVGEWVEVGAPVLRLVAVDKLRAEGFLDADQATSVVVGKRVTIVATNRNQNVTARGVLRFISPEMDPVTKQVRVWAEIDNRAGQLRPGQQGTLEIER